MEKNYQHFGKDDLSMLLFSKHIRKLVFSFHFVVFVAANFRKLRNAVFSLLPFSIAKLWHHKCKFLLRFAVRIPGTWKHVENLKTERNENGSEIKVKEDDHKQSSVLFQMFHLHLVEHWRQWKMVLELKPKNKTKTNRLSYFKKPLEKRMFATPLLVNRVCFSIYTYCIVQTCFSAEFPYRVKPWGTVRWSKIIALAHCVRAYVTQSLIIQHFFLDFH